MSFVWRKFSSVGREKWCNKMKHGQRAQDWGCPLDHPKKYPRSTSVKAWGCPEASPLHQKAPGHFSIHYIFIASHDMCYSWSVFIFVVCLLLFVYWTINGWIHHNYFGEIHAPLLCTRHSSFLIFYISSVLVCLYFV
jgi:hypothetical protein